MAAFILAALGALQPASYRRALLRGAAATLTYGAAATLTCGAPALRAAAAIPTAPAVGTSSVLLSDGTRFPLASFGLQIYDDALAEKLTASALRCGYRNFFASVLARNQAGFARAVAGSAVPRDDLFICGSVGQSARAPAPLRVACDRVGCACHRSGASSATILRMPSPMCMLQ